jgi:hypothetical protein
VVVGGEVAQTMYPHVSKCKNDKVKGEKKRKSKEKHKRKMIVDLPLDLQTCHFSGMFLTLNGSLHVGGSCKVIQTGFQQSFVQ